MPWKTTLERAQKARRQGKRPTTVAGEFVREEMEHVRRGKHGARSPQQAIAIGLSKARRAGVPLPPPKRGRAKPKTIKSAEYAALAARTGATRRRSPRRARDHSGAQARATIHGVAEGTGAPGPCRRAPTTETWSGHARCQAAGAQVRPQAEEGRPAACSGGAARPRAVARSA
jgi:hypothetical protein